MSPRGRWIKLSSGKDVLIISLAKNKLETRVLDRDRYFQSTWAQINAAH